MKRADRTFLLIVATFLGAASAHAGQLVQDPSFELGQSNPYWSCTQITQSCTTENGCGPSSVGLAIINTFSPRTGTYAAHLPSDHDRYAPCKYHRSRLSQVFTIPSNVTSASLNFWVKCNGGGHSLWVELYDAVSGAKYATLAIVGGSFFPYTNFNVLGLENWKGAQVMLLFRTAPIANDDATDWYVDDVTVNTTP